MAFNKAQRNFDLLSQILRGGHVELIEEPEALEASNVVEMTLNLKERHGQELAQMIKEAEANKTEVGAMLCQDVNGNVAVSRTCWGQRSRVEVHDCVQHKRPLGSFHVHLGGVSTFSPQDLKVATRREELSCLGFMKDGQPMLVCIVPRQVYRAAGPVKYEVERLIDEADNLVVKGEMLHRFEPENPKVRLFFNQAQQDLQQATQLLGAFETPLLE